MIQNEFARWVLKNASQLNLNVQEASWTKDWLSGYSNMQVTIEVADQKIIGHGFASSKELAFLKAAGEAIERAICLENNLRSTGVATYPSIEGAQLRASNELKERDVFLCHYLTGVPFQRQLEVSGFEPAQEKLKVEGIKISALQMVTPINEYGVVCFATPIDRKPHCFSSIIGLGYDHQFKSALEKAYLECLQASIHFIYKGKDKNIEVNNLTNPKDHKDLFLTSKHFDVIQHLINNVKDDFCFPKKISVDFEELRFQNPIFTKIPLHFVKATSNGAQIMFYGETTVEKMNLTRLEDFKREPVDISSINFIPHCVG